jgi:hypothetical protein
VNGLVVGTRMRGHWDELPHLYALFLHSIPVNLLYSAGYMRAQGRPPALHESTRCGHFMNSENFMHEMWAVGARISSARRRHCRGIGTAIDKSPRFLYHDSELSAQLGLPVNRAFLGSNLLANPSRASDLLEHTYIYILCETESRP